MLAPLPVEVRLQLERVADIALGWANARHLSAVPARTLARTLGFTLRPRRLWHQEMSKHVPTGAGASDASSIFYCDRGDEQAQNALIAELIAAQVRRFFVIDGLTAQTDEDADRYLARALLLPRRRFRLGERKAARLLPSELLEARRCDVAELEPAAGRRRRARPPAGRRSAEGAA